MNARTHRCGELRKEHVGQTVSVCGWMDTKRDRGGVVFILLRDISGKVQLTFAEEINPELVAKTRDARGEYVLRATGRVQARAQENVTTTMATGEVEIVVSALEVLNTAVTPAIEVRDDLKCDPELRLKHRFIDLRRRPMQAMLQARAAMIRSMRATLDEANFLEIETPILYKRTPEGARDFIVPSRAYRGQFYALPQSPQLFKQLCMVSGLDRYYQIARCFRDEDKRADRQPEFSQLDIEMSFVEREDVIALLEQVVPNFVRALQQDKRFADRDWPVLKCGELKAPFERMTYETAMRDYSIDRPDLRSRDLRLSDLTAWAKGCSFNAFKTAAASGGLVKALRCPGMAETFSRGQISNMERDAKGMGAGGLASLTVGAQHAAPLQGAIAKFFPEAEQRALLEACKAQSGDLVLICAHAKDKVVHAVMHHMRTMVAEKLGLLDPGKFALAWIVDFPLFEYKDDEEKLYASHHPFTLAQDMELVRKMAEACRAYSHKHECSVRDIREIVLRKYHQGQSPTLDSLKLQEFINTQGNKADHELAKRLKQWASSKGLFTETEAENVRSESLATELIGELPEVATALPATPAMRRLKAAGFTLEQVLGIRNNQYDLVLNGIEIAGGSIRMHRTDWQQDVFEMVGITKAEAEKKFGFLMNALAHGAPPHGGIAMGLDRMLMLLLGLETIQDAMAFPKSATGRDLMIDTPNEVEDKLLKELGVSIQA